jgi:hypothetical protein
MLGRKGGEGGGLHNINTVFIESIYMVYF